LFKRKGIQWRVIFLVVLFLGTLVALSLFTQFSLEHARNLAHDLVVREVSREIHHEMTMYLDLSVRGLSDSIRNLTVPQQKSKLKTRSNSLLAWGQRGFLIFYVSKKGEIVAPSLKKTGVNTDRLLKKTFPLLLEMIKKSEEYREYVDATDSERKFFLFLEPIPHTSFFIHIIVDRRKILKTVAVNLSGIAKHGRQIFINIIVVDVLAFFVFLVVSIFIIRKIGRLEDAIHEKGVKLTETNDLLEVEVSIRLTIEKELKDANRELKRLSRVDGLTGIANRRAFDERLEKEWNRAVREKTSLSLLLCDIDFFKRFNDRYGHQEGDECLKKIAAELETHAHRPADLAARYGGEEFAVILPGTDEEGAMKVGEEVRASIEALAIAHEDVVTGTTTISVGCAVMVPEGAEDVSGLIRRADAALYSAKDLGRNRVEIYRP